MSASADAYRVIPVPAGLLDEVLPHAATHLQRGLEVSDMDMPDVVADLRVGRACLWCIFGPMGLMAAFLTRVHDDANGSKSVHISGFGGFGARHWLPALQETMETHARLLSCQTVRFHGRQAWGRLVPRYRAVATDRGAAIYERAI